MRYLLLAPMKIKPMSAMLVVAALGFAACGGGDTPQNAGGSATALPATTSVQAGSNDPCSGSLPTDLFAVEAAADIPTIDSDGEASTLGVDGVAAILDELFGGDGSMCALEVSPGVQAAIEAIRAAASQGDRSEVRRLLEQLIRVDLQAVASPIKSLRSSFAAGDLQKARDALAASKEAGRQGEDDLAVEALEQGGKHFTNYAETAIPATDDPEALVFIAKEALIFNLDGVYSEAIEKAKKIYELRLKEVADRYDPCTANRDEFQELVRATIPVKALGGDSSSGDVLITKSINISIARANGEEHPDCEDPHWVLTMTMHMDTGEGVVTFSWDGDFVVSEGVIDGEGTGTLLGTAECYINGSLVEASPVGGTFTFKVTGTQTATSAGESLVLLVDGENAGVELTPADPTCAGIAEIGRNVLSQIPTLPLLYYPEGFSIEVTGGLAFKEVPMEPYTLQVHVQLSE